MASRCYLLAGLGAAAERDAIVAVVRELEAMEAVVFAEPVVGAYDVVASLETDEAIEDVVRRVQTIAGIETVTPLRVNPIPTRERMWKNLDKIPTRAN